jgi:diadenosine tetraphosphate (Ap4A) HIT family hydrolase
MTNQAAFACITCDLIKRRDNGEAPVWDSILRTELWDLVHSYDTSLLGWLVLIARRHVASLSELTEEEAAEMGSLMRTVSKALESVTGCQKTYVAQFAESRRHPHVHVHVIPRMQDLPEDALGPAVFSRLGAPQDEHVNEAAMEELALEVRSILTERS